MSISAPTLAEFLSGYEVMALVDDPENEDNEFLSGYSYRASDGHVIMRDPDTNIVTISQRTFTVEQVTKFYLSIVPNPTEYLT